MDKDLVLTEIRDGDRVITLNRPDSLNSFNRSVHTALNAALDDAEADTKCRALILTGAGRGFCAGQDLSEVEFTPGQKPDLTVTLEKNYNPLIRRLRKLPLPIICAVNGVAAGGGANIAFACDIVLAARSAKFIQAFSKIALVPDCGGTWFLPRLAGNARARALAMLAEPVSAEQAEAWGMIWKTVDAMLFAVMTESSRRPRIAVCSPIAMPHDVPDAMTGSATFTNRFEISRSVAKSSPGFTRSFLSKTAR